MIHEEKVPYLLTILFIALGWTVSQLSTDMTKSPIIEYKQDRRYATKHTFTITNISSEKLFSDLTFKLRIPGDSQAKCMDSPKIYSTSPTELKSPTNGIPEPKCVDDEYAEFILHHLQPGATVKLEMKTNKEVVDVDIYIWCKNPVRLIEASLQTWVAKNQFGVMGGLICLWTVLIIIYLIWFYSIRVKIVSKMM